MMANATSSAGLMMPLFFSSALSWLRRRCGRLPENASRIPKNSSRILKKNASRISKEIREEKEGKSFDRLVLVS